MMIGWSKVKTNQYIHCTLLKQNKKNWVRAYLICDFKQQFLVFKIVIQTKKKKKNPLPQFTQKKKKTASVISRTRKKIGNFPFSPLN